MKGTYKVIDDGEETSIKGNLVCCDCGLVHRVIPINKKNKLLVKVFRDEDHTMRIRKVRNIVISQGKPPEFLEGKPVLV